MCRNIALAFHNWMIKNRWILHLSKEYYYIDNGSWPPPKTLSEEELLDEFFNK
jgi:hypothetical protein